MNIKNLLLATKTFYKKIYEESFKKSELGRIHALLPLHEEKVYPMMCEASCELGLTA